MSFYDERFVAQLSVEYPEILPSSLFDTITFSTSLLKYSAVLWIPVESIDSMRKDCIEFAKVKLMIGEPLTFVDASDIRVN